MENLRFPIGRWGKPAKLNLTRIKKQISIIKKFPNAIKKEVGGLTTEQLKLTYRPEGWSVRQVVHHCADSHMNAFIRFKLCLTEEQPVIKPYLEAKWAEMEDGNSADIKLSLQILTAVHKRWVILLKTITPEQWNRTYFHPENGNHYHLFDAVSLYAWHCEHHLAHVQLVTGSLHKK